LLLWGSEPKQKGVGYLLSTKDDFCCVLPAQDGFKMVWIQKGMGGIVSFFTFAKVGELKRRRVS
jgi:hypothetical protein